MNGKMYPVDAEKPGTRICLARSRTAFGAALVSIALHCAAADFVTVTASVFDPSGREFSDQMSFSSVADITHAIDNIQNGFFNHDVELYKAAGKDPHVTATVTVQGSEIVLNADRGFRSIQVDSNDLDIHQAFTGADRSESARLMGQWFKDHAASLIRTVNSGTRFGMVAGNPASFVSQTAMIDQGIDGTNVLRQDQDKESRFSLAARFSNYSINGRNTQVYLLPLGYTWELGDGWAALFSLPLTYVDAMGVPSYGVSFGTGLRIPVSRYLDPARLKWDLIPLFRVGAVGSDQNQSGTSIVYSGGIQSNMGLAIGSGYSLILHNQYNYFLATSVTSYVNFTIDGTRYRVPDIVNHVYRNGLQVLKDFDAKWLGRRVMGSVFFVDTRFDGTAVYTTNQQEFGFDIGLRALTESAPVDMTAGTAETVRTTLSTSDLKLGLTYTRAAGLSNSISANLGWSF